VKTYRWHVFENMDVYECRTSRHKFRDIFDASVVHGVRLLAGESFISTYICIQNVHILQYHTEYHILQYHSHPDRVRRSVEASKDRRCDATFAF
jgi:hypothetical protein